ncbi:MAG TPA: permease-like cell division protein FtsX [Candidatus Paceibacterota bacterium]|jgi:cell division transport system permease protein|nr:permease-like cell division protein FtsX [Candidatus Paceibacterota bacterium]
MAFWTTTKRVARYGFIGFLRNGFVSFSAVLVMTITLFVIAALLIGNAALNSTLQYLQSQVAVTVYFTPDATVDQIQTLQTDLAALPEVQSVSYVSSDQALADFQERHANDQLTLQALNELTGNPLGAELQIRAKDPTQYAAIAQYVEAQQSQNAAIGSSIDKVDYQQNQTAITRLSAIIQTSKEIGIAVAIIFGLASILIAFNTIRLAIYTARDEITVMNLVGASHWYVRGPFIIAGVLYGVLSGIIVLLLLYPITAALGPGSEEFLGTFNAFSYFTGSFAFLLLIIMGSGVVLGAISSYLAIRRYLRA